jgi:hypothetical protein
MGCQSSNLNFKLLFSLIKARASSTNCTMGNLAAQHTYIQSMLNLPRFISFLLYKSLIMLIKLKQLLNINQWYLWLGNRIEHELIMSNEMHKCRLSWQTIQDVYLTHYWNCLNYIASVLPLVSGRVRVLSRENTDTKWSQVIS